MKITALSIFLAASSLVSASPVYKRQEVTSAIASVATDGAATVTSAVAEVTSTVSSAIAGGEESASASASAAQPSGSQDFGAGLLAALRDRQANTLAALIEPMAGTLGPILQEGDWTIFAPGDEYLAAVPESVTSNQTLLTQILTYHIVAGNYPADQLVENQTVIAPSLLDNNMLGESYTKFPLAFAQDQFGTTRVLGQNASVLGNTTYQNVLVKLIDGVLLPPGNVSSVLAANGGDALAGALTQLLPDVVQALDTTQGITLFAPDNESVESAAATLASLAQSDPESVTNVINGHALQGVYFSTNISDGDVNSLAGTPLSFMVNDTGVFVTGNGVTAQVTQPDLIAENGVVHIIDALLFTPPAAESSAAESAAPASETDAEGTATSAVGGAAETATSAAGGAVETATSGVAAGAGAATSVAGGVVGTVTSGVANVVPTQA